MDEVRKAAKQYLAGEITMLEWRNFLVLFLVKENQNSEIVLGIIADILGSEES